LANDRVFSVGQPATGWPDVPASADGVTPGAADWLDPAVSLPPQPTSSAAAISNGSSRAARVRPIK
jgi:hypothetical protein